MKFDGTVFKGAFCAFAIGMYLLLMGCGQVVPEEKTLASTPKEAVEMYLDQQGAEGVESVEITDMKPKQTDGSEYIYFKAYGEDGRVLYSGSVCKDLYME